MNKLYRPDQRPKLAVAVYATKSYLYAWEACITAIATALNGIEPGIFIFSTDDSPEAEIAYQIAARILPVGWAIHPKLVHKFPGDTSRDETGPNNWKLRISEIQNSAFMAARRMEVEYFWSVESDVIVTPDSFRLLFHYLNTPSADGSRLYDIAAGTYPNNGALLGFGSPSNWIYKDYLPHERKLPKRFRKVLEECEKRIHTFDPKTVDLKSVQKEHRRRGRLYQESEQYGSDGTIWEVIAKYGWRRRGWLDNAMPACVANTFVSDWCGMGCTLLNKKALQYANFIGYDGGGTQDLFLCWKKWYPQRIQILGVPQVWCDHIKRRENRIEHLLAWREPEGEFKDHMRITPANWTDQTPKCIANSPLTEPQKGAEIQLVENIVPLQTK